MASRQRTSSPTTTASGPKSPAAEKKSNYHPPNEFGGPFGAFLGLVGLPATIYYLWLCAEFNKGSMILASEVDGVSIWTFLKEKATPTVFSAVVYLSWVALQAVLAIIGPGPVGEGALLADGKTRLKYKFNGLFAWYSTLVLVAVLHFTGTFRLHLLAEHFGELLTTSSIVATLLSVYCYISAHAKGTTERMSGVLHYDFFMGAELNPRVAGFDIKFFVEIRPGIMLWFFFTLSFLAKQYEQHGFVTLPMVLLAFYHLCYANACYKGEECIPMSMDIIYEKFGWMLCYANMVWVPFTYCIPAVYLLHIPPYSPPVAWSLAVLALHVAGYYIFDTSNSQKDYFRAKNPETHARRGFPRFASGRLQNPKSIPTQIPGKSLLIDGWWGVARHINYTGDLMMAWAWGLTCGFGSLLPYFYAIYMTILLVHRERRDDYDCKKKYGAIWDKYCATVPYRFIKGVY